jgi:hypothetical protein
LAAKFSMQLKQAGMMTVDAAAFKKKILIN